MGRLCERPGCSEVAAVAYGMRTDDLVFWLDVLRESTPVAGGVLCQRHGDSMVVPRGWTLDDLRDPELHLFRPPSRAARARPRARRRAEATPVDHDHDHDPEQLELGGLRVPPDAPAEQAGSATDPVADPVTSPVADPVTDDATGPAAHPDERWTPSFDAADDLGGLLSARGPLLSRAFRGTDRSD
jgi:hypothetical protein